MSFSEKAEYPSRLIAASTSCVRFALATFTVIDG
jgi:hypothetical protein